MFTECKISLVWNGRFRTSRSEINYLLFPYYICNLRSFRPFSTLQHNLKTNSNFVSINLKNVWSGTILKTRYMRMSYKVQNTGYLKYWPYKSYNKQWPERANRRWECCRRSWVSWPRSRRRPWAWGPAWWSWAAAAHAAPAGTWSCSGSGR